MKNLELKTQREEFDKVARLSEEVYQVPQEFREAKKKEFWKAMQDYSIKFKTKYNKFKRP